MHIKFNVVAKLVQSADENRLMFTTKKSIGNVEIKVEENVETLIIFWPIII